MISVFFLSKNTHHCDSSVFNVWIFYISLFYIIINNKYQCFGQLVAQNRNIRELVMAKFVFFPDIFCLADELIWKIIICRNLFIQNKTY